MMERSGREETKKKEKLNKTRRYRKRVGGGRNFQKVESTL